MSLTYCPECLKKQQRINDFDEEVAALKGRLWHEERTVAEGPFGSSTPSSKLSIKPSALLERQPASARLDFHDKTAAAFPHLPHLMIFQSYSSFGLSSRKVGCWWTFVGRKHVLGMVEGASENSAAATRLLEDLVAPGRRRLFVIDGSKALRAAVDAVYGADNPVQRCRRHKIRNVTEQVPKHLRDQVKAAMRAAYRLDAK